MPEIKQLEELQGKLTAVQARVAGAFAEAKVEQDGKATYDFALVKTYGDDLSTRAIAEKIELDDAQMNDLGEQIETLKAAEAAYDRAQKPVKRMVHPGDDSRSFEPGEKKAATVKSLGELIVADPQFAAWAKAEGQKTGEISIPEYGLAQLNTLLETPAGWSPESVRSGRLVDAVTRPIQVLDIIPTGQVDQTAYVYMLETTRSHGAAAKAEGGTYAESQFVLTETSKTVRKITDSVPVTDEQLEDVSAARSYLDMRIRFGIRQYLDDQILNGSGSAPELDGILNEGGIQTQAKGADPVPDAFYKAMTKIRVTGRANPSAHIMHPNDWQTIRLLRTVDGIYIWGNPSEAGPERLWGLPVVQADSIAEGTGLVGAFADFCQLFERRGLVVEVGFTGSQFVEGKQTIRATLRVVLAIYRPAAFATVTGL